MEHPDVSMILNNLAQLRVAQGRYTEAELLFRRALSIRKKASGSDQRPSAVIMSNLAKVCCQTGKLAEAEPFYRRAIAIREKTLEPNHLDLAVSLNGYALLLQKTRRKSEASAINTRIKQILAKNPDVQSASHTVKVQDLEAKKSWKE
jgi:tetratricopeptide (TPR) repeat protein